MLATWWVLTAQFTVIVIIMTVATVRIVVMTWDDGLLGSTLVGTVGLSSCGQDTVYCVELYNSERYFKCCILYIQTHTHTHF